MTLDVRAAGEGTSTNAANTGDNGVTSRSEGATR
jgi:hypothetical protein